jgi:hypothetical protein
MAPITSSARFDETGSTVVVEELTIEDNDVVAEARCWTRGERGPRCDDTSELAGADLTRFVTEALTLGAKMLTLSAQTTETRALERMVRDVGDKTAEASRRAGETAAEAARSATDTVVKAAADAKKAIADADEVTRKHLSDAVASTKTELLAETRRLFGGDSPELLEKLQPILDRFSTMLDKNVQAGTSELIERAAKQLDPSDPTSPMAKHAAGIAEQQERFAKQIEKGQAELSAKVDDLSTALKVQGAKAALTKVTPIKGGSFEDELHEVMRDIAAGLGDEYAETGTTTGLVPRSKKGDGLLTVAGQDARVVIEMTDSPRTNWTDYFDEAERNRGASASLGIVRTVEQNSGHTIRVVGQRRVVIAFNPGEHDTEVLRTVTLLLRTVAIAASVRTGEAAIDTAEEKIVEAIEQLEKIDSIKKTAASIQKSAGKIEGDCTSIATGIRRLLDQALISLAGTAPTLAGGEPATIHGVA